MINGDKFINILSKPACDDEAKNIMSSLQMPPPIKDEAYNGVSVMRTTQDGSVQFSFDEELRTKKQKEGYYGVGNFYLYNIIIENVHDVILPFDFTEDSSYLDVMDFFNKEPYQSRKNIRSWLLQDDDKQYGFAVFFKNDALEGISSINMVVKNEIG